MNERDAVSNVLTFETSSPFIQRNRSISCKLITSVLFFCVLHIYLDTPQCFYLLFLVYGKKYSIYRFNIELNLYLISLACEGNI